MKPRFSAKFLEGLASSFYGKVSQTAPIVAGGHSDEEPAASVEDEQVEVTPVEPTEPVSQPELNGEGVLHSKLSEVRTLAAEAREAGDHYFGKVTADAVLAYLNNAVSAGMIRKR